MKKDKGNMKLRGMCYEDVIRILSNNGYDVKVSVKNHGFNDPEAEITFKKTERMELPFE